MPDVQLLIFGEERIVADNVLTAFLNPEKRTDFRFPRTREVNVDGRIYTVYPMNADTANLSESSIAFELSESRGAAIVFSVSVKESFDAVKSLHDLILRLRHVEQFPMVVIGNVSLPQYLKGKPRVVTAEEARKLADSLSCPYFEVSSETHDGILDAFKELVRLSDLRSNCVVIQPLPIHHL